MWKSSASNLVVDDEKSHDSGNKKTTENWSSGSNQSPLSSNYSLDLTTPDYINRIGNWVFECAEQGTVGNIDELEDIMAPSAPFKIVPISALFGKSCAEEDEESRKAALICFHKFQDHVRLSLPLIEISSFNDSRDNAWSSPRVISWSHRISVAR